jgi:ferredoxin
VITAPTVFDQDEKEGVVAPRATDPTPDLLDRVREAVRLCPCAALSTAE